MFKAPDWPGSRSRKEDGRVGRWKKKDEEKKKKRGRRNELKRESAGGKVLPYEVKRENAGTLLSVDFAGLARRCTKTSVG